VNRSFGALATGSFLSLIGTAVFDLVLAWWIVSETGSAVATGYLLAASLAPIAFIGPIGGVLSDRWNKKTILIVTDVLSGAIVMGVAALVHQGVVNVPLMVAASFLLGTCCALYRPAARSILPQLVDQRNLVRANSISTNLIETTKAVGPMLGAALIAIPAIGVTGAIIVNGLSFWASAAATLLITYRHTATGKNLTSVRRDLRDGFTYVKDQVLIRNMVLLCGAVNFFLVAFNILLPVYLTKVLHASSSTYGYALTAEAVGGIAISVILLLWKNVTVTNRLLVTLLVAGGASLALMPAVSGTGELLALCAAQGFFVGGFNTLFFTHIQTEVRQEYLGRVFSVVYMVAIGVMPVAYVIWGYIGDSSIRWSLAYAGIGTILCGLPFALPRQRTAEARRPVVAA
jgi:DHA3 family macrolide efflux protein-like MFS transporter